MMARRPDSRYFYLFLNGTAAWYAGKTISVFPTAHTPLYAKAKPEVRFEIINQRSESASPNF